MRFPWIWLGVAAAVAALMAPAAMAVEPVELPPIPGLDADGFLFHSGADASFWWRMDAFYPENVPVLGLEAFAPTYRVELRLKGIEGALEFEKRGEMVFDGAEKVEETAYTYAVTPAGTELKVTVEEPVHAFLGEVYAGARTAGMHRINGKKFNSFYAHLPAGTEAVYFRDVSNPASVFQLDEKNVFFYNPLTAAVAYVDASANAKAGVFFVLVALLFFWLAKNARRVPAFDLQPRHFLFVLLVVMVVGTQFAFWASKPGLVMVLDDDVVLDDSIGAAGVTGEGGGKGVRADEQTLLFTAGSPRYLWWALAATGAIDKVVVGRTRNCAPHDLFSGKHHFMTAAGGASLTVLESAENECIAWLQGAYRDTPASGPVLGLLAPYREALYKRVFVLFLLMQALALAWLVLAWGRVKRLEDGVRAGAASLAVAFGVPLMVLTQGFLARLPVSYHGAAGSWYTMGSRFWPGVLGQGHNVALAVSVAAVIGVVLFNRAWRPRFSVRALFLVAGVGALLFVLPFSGHFMKRNILSLACADCVLDATSDSPYTSLIKFYVPVQYGNLPQRLLGQEKARENEQLFKDVQQLIYTGEKGEAIRLLDDALAGELDSASRAEVFYWRGELHNARGEWQDAADDFDGVAETLPNHERAAVALHKAGVIYHTALASREEAVKRFERVYAEYGESPWAAESMYFLALNYQAMGRKEEAVQLMREVVARFPESAAAGRARETLERWGAS